MRPPFSFRHLTLSAVVAGFVAVLVGYTSTAALIFQAARAAGASADQIGGWLTMLGLGMGITSLGLSLWYRMPVLAAWSTPGAALLATSLQGLTLPQATGVFVFSNLLILLLGISGLFARLMKSIPQAICAAMLAGILLQFGLRAFHGLQNDALLVGVMCMTWLLARRLLPRYTIVVTLLAGLMCAVLQGHLTPGQQPLHVAVPQWITPEFSLSSLVGVALPYVIVTMAAQNAPGIATLQAAGYRPATSVLIGVTALVALLFSPFGGFTVCIAAITAAICMGSDVHSDPAKRYWGAAMAGVFYLLAGLSGGAVSWLLSALPLSLIQTIAGLALVGTITSSLQRSLADDRQRDAAMITFLITASGLTLWGIGAAFWGMLSGILSWLILTRPTTLISGR